MKKELAEQVLEEVRAKYSWYTDIPGYNGPTLYNGTHEELSEDAWVISWDEGPDGWATESWPTKVPGAFVEPVYSWCLAVFDA